MRIRFIHRFISITLLLFLSPLWLFMVLGFSPLHAAPLGNCPEALQKSWAQIGEIISQYPDSAELLLHGINTQQVCWQKPERYFDYWRVQATVRFYQGQPWFY